MSHKANPTYENLVHKEKAQAEKGYGVIFGIETGLTFVHVSL